jgi:hypothetical protein
MSKKNKAANKEQAAGVADPVADPPAAQEPAAPVVNTLTLDDLRELGAVRSEASDGKGGHDVNTKGGAALHFPGDEEKAANLSVEELIGAEPPAPPATTEAADTQALLGSLTPTQRAMAHWGLEPRHVLGSKEHPQEDSSVDVVIVTQGGQKLRWPRDSARVLSDMEKGDGVPNAPSGGIFGSK